MKKILLILIAVITLLSVTACNKDDNSNEDYNMDYALDAHQYTLFLNRHIDVVIEQQTSSMLILQRISADKSQNDSLIDALEASVGTIESAIHQVETMHPPKQYKENCENVLNIMDHTLSILSDCIEEAKKEVVDLDVFASYELELQNDFIALTAEHNVYYK